MVATTRPAERVVESANEVSRSELPWARPAPRSVELESAMQQATGYTRRAFELAERHAFFSARAEFVESLRMIAQVYDTQQQTSVNTKSLNNGLTALKETADFRIRGASAANLDLTHIVAGHRTPVLKDHDTSEMTPLVALQRYYSYAQEQLAAAANGEPAGSMALYGLGRITVDGPSVTKAAKLENATQAVVYYQAALLTNGMNYRAANELGVQLANLGRLEQSRVILMHCVQIAPNAATWRNLSNVHARLGERDEAAFAQAQAQVAAKMAPAQQNELNVQWVDATTFGQTAAAQEGLLAPANDAQKPTKQVPPPPAPATAKKPSIWNPFKSTQQR
jgi:tetratricopeptide (TPR) repeat protein